MNDLILGDCLTELRSMGDDCVDLTITSPPYNMNLRIRNGEYTSRQIVKELSTKYEGFPDNLPMEKYYEFNRDVITELLRVSPLVFYNVQFLTGNKVALFDLIGHFSKQLKEVIIWDKMNAQPAIGKGVMNSRYEVILVFDRKNAISRYFSQAKFKRGTLENLWQIKRGKKIDASHGAVFPEELVTKIIKNFSSKGDIVLDPFLGTGTTALVAKKLGRKYIGIEIGQPYMEIAKRRLEDHKN
ncbi:MAG: site-specific DNA-methyltransferase [Patescibacteria group bacterium]